MKKGNLLARGEVDTRAGSALPDMFVTRGLPLMGEKAVEMTRGQFNKTISIGNSIICSDIWHKYHQ